jgi:hypothetical protein
MAGSQSNGMDIGAFAKDVRSVVAAGRRLESALGDVPPVRRAAARRLEDALAGSAALAPQRFSPPKAAPAALAPFTTEDTFGALLLEAQTANLSLAASRVTDELGSPDDVGVFQDALRELSTTAAALERSGAARQGAIPTGGQLGFRSPARPPAAPSSSIEGARANLGTGVDSAVDSIVDDSHRVVCAVGSEAIQLPGSALLPDLVMMAVPFDAAVKLAGRLAAAGLVKLRAAIRGLHAAFGLAGVEAAAAEVEQIWGRWRDADPLREALRRMYGSAATLMSRDRAIIEERTIGWLDEARGSIESLGRRFAEAMRLAEKLLGAFVIASGIVSLIPGAGAPGLALTAAGHLLLLAGVVLTGKDFVGSGSALGRVAGIRSILEDRA